MDSAKSNHDIEKALLKVLDDPEITLYILDEKGKEINQKWDQNIESIGRILRSHLFVEYYMNKCLLSNTPELHPLLKEDAEIKLKLSFSQKAALLKESRAELEYLIPGINHLNRIRNRIGHNLQSDLSKKDSDIFLAVTFFKQMRIRTNNPLEELSEHPLDILEDFAHHAGWVLDLLS